MQKFVLRPHLEREVDERFERAYKRMGLDPNAAALDNYNLEQLDYALNELEPLTDATYFWRMTGPSPDSSQKANSLAPNFDIVYRGHVLPHLIDLKTELLDRSRAVRALAEIDSIKVSVSQKVPDGEVKNELLKVIDEAVTNSLLGNESFREQLDETQRRRQQIEVENLKSDSELARAERKSRMRRSWFERESMASIVGSVLLLTLGLAIVVSMFVGVAVTEIVSSAFLLILGYFFGQVTGKSREVD